MSLGFEKVKNPFFFFSFPFSLCITRTNFIEIIRANFTIGEVRFSSVYIQLQTQVEVALAAADGDTIIAGEILMSQPSR